MEAKEIESPHAEVELITNDEVYVGYFDTATLNRLQAIGVLTIVGEFDDGRQALKLVERDDFLASFAAGVSEARNGSDMHYADYSNNQYAFSAGYEHWHERNKKALKGKLTHYSGDAHSVCHGFIDADTGDIHRQQ